MATATDLLTLTQWFGANFPVGSYAYSHGLEAMISDEAVTDKDSFANWLHDVVEFGSGRQDAILLSLAYRGDAEQVAELALALSSSGERHFETTQQGRAFGQVVANVWGDAQSAWPFCVTAGAAAQTHGLPLEQTLVFYLQGFVSNLCTIAARAIPIGQSDAQQVLRDMGPVIERIAQVALTATEDDLGSAAFAGDIAAIAHETQTVRIFRT
ncbi:hypothetical protein BVC71_03695 [Marivivens niveibacter]|uniref:Urease accessory protein UreF n=1 Tax=Marivivens niveibacter TaxID=1930667 RepID=A0A251X2G3_9RHOB|nr:urease accessory UreF family protein [Marivivens niveibacter]OUD10605.1 hypothetical protein BVC71_03695 [Marivivens niveibacter]